MYESEFLLRLKNQVKCAISYQDSHYNEALMCYKAKFRRIE